MPVYRHSIFEIQKEELGGYLYLSVFSHLMVGVTFFLLPSFLNPSPDPWGGSQGGGSMAIGLVDQSSIRGLNLPRPKQTTASNTATESKGLGQTEEAKAAKPEAEVPDPKAFEVKKKKKPKVKKRKRAVKRAPKPKTVAQAPPPSNRVPFGEGGAPDLSYSQFRTGRGSGGIGLGDGFFGKKYGSYVRRIRDIVSRNWLKNLVSPNVRSSERVVIQFTIHRNGSITNEFIKESSGIPSLDRSGLRAIKASRFPPLPGGETRLVAEFWFEHSR
jgi:TonB family protein